MPENAASFPKSQIERILAESAVQVLETMFFTLPAEEPVEFEPDQDIVTCIKFRGNPNGEFYHRINRRAAAELAANFLGQDPGEEVTDEQIYSVTSELTNVMAGAVLSCLESDSLFELDPPLSCPPDSWSVAPEAAFCRIELENGRIELCLDIKQAA